MPPVQALKNSKIRLKLIREMLRLATAAGEAIITIYEQDFTNSLSLSNESKNLYQQIQEGDRVSAFIKERVKKINDFQKYK